MANERLRVVEVLEAAAGGTRKHLLELCQGLDPARFELHVLISPRRDPAPQLTHELLARAGVQVTSIPMRRGLSVAADLHCVRLIEQALRRVQPHLVHTHSSKAGFLGRLAALRVPGPGIIHTPHGFPFLMDAPLPVRALYRGVERALGRRSDRIIGVCESERLLAIATRIAPAERCVTIENGIDFATPSPRPRPERLELLGLPPDARVVLCVGDLRPQKRHTLAVAAMPAVLRAEPRAYLVIAGEGPERGRLQALAAAVAPGRVQLLGPRDDIPELLAGCDVFCQPSAWEGCPYALIEAAGASCALVGYDIPGVSDIIRDGVTGWLVPRGSRAAMTAGLAGALGAALGDGAVRRARGEAAAQFVRERHSLARMVALTARLYEEVAAEHQPSHIGR